MLEELGVVDEDVDPVQRREGVVGHAELRCVVGHVGDRARPGAHAVAEGAATLVGDLEGRAPRSPRPRARPGCTASKVQAPFRPSGVIGKAGGDIIWATRSRPDLPPWAGTTSRTDAPARSPAAKNGMPCTWSQCRWLTRMVPRKGAPPSIVRDAADAGARVEHEGGGRVPVDGDRDAGGVAAVADEVATGGTHRATHSEEVDAHKSSLRARLRWIRRLDALSVWESSDSECAPRTDLPKWSTPDDRPAPPRPAPDAGLGRRGARCAVARRRRHARLRRRLGLHRADRAAVPAGPDRGRGDRRDAQPGLRPDADHRGDPGRRAAEVRRRRAAVPLPG